MLKTTPFHERTSALCVSHAWRRWAGYVVASSYELSHEREYHSIRAAAALFDVSPLYKYLVKGKDAARLLDRVVTRNVLRSQVGQVLYTPWCDAAGKVIDDGTVARLDETLFRMTAAEPNLRWREADAAGRAAAAKVLSPGANAAAGDPGKRQPHRLHRGPRFRDLGRCGQGHCPVGRAHGRGRAVRDPAGRDAGARCGAHRSGADADRRRLRSRPQGIDREPGFLALRARSRLGGQSGQGA